MKTTLKRTLPVTRAALFAELALFESRPELGHLCRAVAPPPALGNEVGTEMGTESGTRAGAATRVDAQGVRAALPGVSDAGAEQIVAAGRDLGLWDQAGRLTAFGRSCAADDQAPVPEQGTYGLWLVADPLLGGCRPLGLERADDASGPPVRQADLEPLAAHPPLNQLLELRGPEQTRLVLRDLPRHAQGLPARLLDTRARCDLRWQLDFEGGTAGWWLEGQLDPAVGGGPNGRAQPRPLHGQTTAVDLDLDALLAAWGRGPLAEFGRWDHATRRLAVDRADLPAAAQARFRHTLSLRSVEVPGYGAFEAVALEDVPVGPRGPAEAEDWADALLVRALCTEPRYRGAEDLARLFDEIVEGTPLAAYGLAAPGAEDLLSQADLCADPHVFWSFVAPFDLAPGDPTRASLDADVVSS